MYIMFTMLRYYICVEKNEVGNTCRASFALKVYGKQMNIGVLSPTSLGARVGWQLQQGPESEEDHSTSSATCHQRR